MSILNFYLFLTDEFEDKTCDFCYCFLQRISKLVLEVLGVLCWLLSVNSLSSGCIHSNLPVLIQILPSMMIQTLIYFYNLRPDTLITHFGCYGLGENFSQNWLHQNAIFSQRGIDLLLGKDQGKQYRLKQKKLNKCDLCSGNRVC